MNSTARTLAAANIDGVIYEFPNKFRLYRSGRVERLFPDELVPPSLNPVNGVLSKDITINPITGLSVRLYLPSSILTNQKKLPVLITVHGGSFFLMRSSSSIYHNYINSLTAKAGVVVISVDYRLAPENHVSAIYDDCWDALQWASSAADRWLSEFGDLENIILVGDSAGGNAVHDMVMRIGREGRKIEGMVLIHPYFWGTKRIGGETVENPNGKSLRVEDADWFWQIACPDSMGLDDPRINPMADGAPSLGFLGCRRVLVCVSELDLLRDRGRLYYDKLKESQWEGDAEFFETEDEDHSFFLFKPGHVKVEEFCELVANFCNKT